jgi:hypothetical protein
VLVGMKEPIVNTNLPCLWWVGKPNGTGGHVSNRDTTLAKCQGGQKEYYDNNESISVFHGGRIMP